MADSRKIIPTSFVAKAGITLPEVCVAGALDGWKYNLFPASKLNLPIDLFMQFSIGDFLANFPCSSYFQPASPWYNVFYGSYAIQSFKQGGIAWGFQASGQPDYDEFFQVPSIDYNYFTAGMFGAPASAMCFQVTSRSPITVGNGWNGIAVEATVPSGLHQPPKPIDYPWAYLMYGVPDPGFVSAAHPEYEPVAMTGQLFIKQKATNPPITLAWGALCPKANGGPALLGQIVSAMSPFLNL
jgi:hypothetical protein